MINEPLKPEACGECSACKKSENDPWRCKRPWNVGKLLGPLDTWYDPATGLKKSKSLSGRTYDAGSSALSYRSAGERDFFGDSWDNVEHKTAKDFKPYAKCAHSHPPLVVSLADGKSVTIYGGAASSPVVKDCDIYVSLDSYSGEQSYPWDEPGPIHVSFPVTDMAAPKDPVEFKKMVKWIVAQLLAGKKVHIGCIGGHGRTGMLLAALVMELTGEVDAITFVRQHYCKKAVESDSQVKFLGKEFGIKAAKPTKDYSYGEAKSSNGKTYDAKGYTVEKPTTQTDKFNSRYGDLFKGSEVTLPVKPVGRKGNIWSRD